MNLRKNERFALEQSKDPSWFREFRAGGAVGSLLVASVFFVVTSGILMLRLDVIAYRPGQYVEHNITSRVDFDFSDADQLARLREYAREQEPRVYQEETGDYWGALQDELMTLPDRTYDRRLSELPPELRAVLDPGDLLALQAYHGAYREKYNQAVRRFIERARQQLTVGGGPLVILPADQRQDELNRAAGADEDLVRYVTLYPSRRANVATETYSSGADLPPEVQTQLQNMSDPMPLALKPLVAQITYDFLQRHPTHELDLAATKAAQDRAADDVPVTAADEHYPHDTVIVAKGAISDRDWQVLRAENDAFLATEESGWIKQLAGTGLSVLILTGVLSAYVARYQPRVVRNPIRAVVLAALMMAMLLISGLAGIGSGSLYYFGLAPTILSAIILTIAYDQRFAIGVGSIQAMLVTCALNQGVGFLLILLIGVLVVCFMLNDVRTRSKLIEVGGAAAIAMMAATAATGMTSLEAMRFVAHNTLYAGAAGMTAGFVTLGILPFIEKIFHITTSMTLLELADATQPLLRRLAIDAPGTYNHSLQVATLAEAAAESIGANALACRVGGYYHDIGKVNKSDYFAENQAGGPSRHLNLSPNVSLMIVIGHVKDGMELARRHHLPPSILQFIQQHHGTTLVEFFYAEACKLCGPGAESVSETQFRYPGPKPKSRETAIMMLADCCESACRAMGQPDANKIEALVHELSMRRLHDGQFDECDLTLRDLDRIQRALIKALLGLYHTRLAYPSTSQRPAAESPARKLA
jgi:cyclic-di-AMP phosphodiesterase PgpH